MLGEPPRAGGRGGREGQCEQQGGRDEETVSGRDRIRVRERAEERRQRPPLRGDLDGVPDPPREAGLGLGREVGAEGGGDLGIAQASVVHASASIARSSARRAAWSRHFAVPVGMPRVRAISATGRSSTW